MLDQSLVLLALPFQSQSHLLGSDLTVPWLRSRRPFGEPDTTRCACGALRCAPERSAARQVWHGAGRGPEVNLEMTVVFTVRDRRIFYVEFFRDHAKALETLGLSE